MKIELEEPYKSDFKAAYCYKNSEPRRTISLIREDGSRTSTSYARYLMACHLDRYLEDDEHVDHINEDPLDDRIENLQILSPEENNRKSASRKYLVMICPVCEEEFRKEYRQTAKGKNLDRKYDTCSRSCSGKTTHMNKENLENKFKVIDTVRK